jgi:hypothetical protein
MPRLPDRWVQHLESGTSHRLGSCGADGRPEICRALAARAGSDGCIEVLLAADVGRAVIAAVQATQRVAHVAAHLDTNVALQTKGSDAQVLPASPEHLELLARCRDRFAEVALRHGVSRDQIMNVWYDVDLALLRCLRFTPFEATDQTPGRDRAGAVELLT